MRWRRKFRQPPPDTAAVDRIIARNVALATRLDGDDRARLRELAQHLVAHKRWEPVGEIALTDEVVVTIAANAAIPILSHGVDAYRGVQSILIHPTTRHSHDVRAGPADGVVTDTPIATVGQASPNRGPLSISWDTARRESRAPAAGRNVVIHEFAHKIDMLDGYSDGTPPLSGDDLTTWRAQLADEYERAEPDPSDEVLRPYAWASPAEFFAVCTEAFFCTPIRLRDTKPRLYEALAAVYDLDPARDWHHP